MIKKRKRITRFSKKNGPVGTYYGKIKGWAAHTIRQNAYIPMLVLDQRSSGFRIQMKYILHAYLLFLVFVSKYIIETYATDCYTQAINKYVKFTSYGTKPFLTN